MVQTVLLLLSTGRANLAQVEVQQAVRSRSCCRRPSDLSHVFIFDEQGLSVIYEASQKKKRRWISLSSSHHLPTAAIKWQQFKKKSVRQLSLLQTLSNKVQINALIKWAAQSYKSLTASPSPGHTHTWMCCLCGCNIYCCAKMPRRRSLSFPLWAEFIVVVEMTK